MLTNAISCLQPTVARYHVRAGQATGSFQTDNTYGVGNRAVSVATGDLNGNGSVDLVTANVNSSNVSVLLNMNDGTGTFQSQTTYPVGSSASSPQAVAIGDLNGDGTLDIVSTTEDGAVAVLLNTNDGTGTFQSQTTVWVTGLPSRSAT